MYFIASIFSEMLSSTSVTTEGTDFGGTLMEAYTPALKYVAIKIF